MIERFAEGLSERDEPLHSFGGEPGRSSRGECLDAHFVAFSYLMEGENHGQDHKTRHKLQPPAPVNLAGPVEQPCASGLEKIANSAAVSPSSRNRSLRPISRIQS